MSQVPWKGTFQQGSVETYDDLMDCACPQCDVFDSPILAEVLYPTTEELVANADRPGVREWILMIEKAPELKQSEQPFETDADKVVKDADSLFHKPTCAEIAAQPAAQDQLQAQLRLTFDAKSQTLDEQQRSSVRSSNEHGPMRPVPGVPGVAWERTEYGTTLILEPNPEFDSLPPDERSGIIDRLLKCVAAPQHYQRVSALRDEFSNTEGKEGREYEN